VGNLLLKHVRGEDVPCRYGGDEFIIILPDASRTVTCERAKLICECAKQFHLKFAGQVLETVTLSLGVAVFPEHGSTSAAILRAVDDALYRAKHEGRSRVVVAG
jgi:diguanylate cyclase (GGDEF)-like protein